MSDEAMSGAKPAKPQTVYSLSGPALLVGLAIAFFLGLALAGVSGAREAGYVKGFEAAKAVCMDNQWRCKDAVPTP